MAHQTSDGQYLDPRLPVILRHARRAFMTDGYAGTRMEPIARASGVSTATLYAFFSGKSELFGAVIGELSIEFQRHMNAVAPHDGDPRQQLLHFCEGYAAFMMDPFVQSILRLVMAERHRFPELADDFFENGRRDFGGLVIGAIMQLRRPGEMELETAIQAAEQLLGMVEHPTFVVPMLGGAPRRPERTAHEIAREAVTTLLARYGRLTNGHG